MLLRSITKHVKDQNWFAVGIDFFIVVLGILIAFQITNWSEAWSDRKLERHYLERLIEDVDRSIDGNIQTMNFVENNQANAWVVHESLSACNVPQGKYKKFYNGIFQLGRFLPVEYNLGTITEMQSAGNFSIIQNSDIRTRLNTLVSDSREYAEIVPSIAGRVGPLLVQFDRFLILNREHIKPWSGSVEIDEVQIDLKSMCADKELLPALSMIRSINQFHIDRYVLALKTLNETRALLRAELGLEEVEATP